MDNSLSIMFVNDSALNQTVITYEPGEVLEMRSKEL